MIDDKDHLLNNDIISLFSVFSIESLKSQTSNPINILKTKILEISKKFKTHLSDIKEELLLN